MTNPGNIVRIRSRNGGRGSVYEANMWAQGLSQGLYSGNGALQNTVPDMNILVGGSTSNPDVIVGTNPSGYRIVLDIIGQQAVLITKPASNSRIASVVAYTDDLSTASTQTTVTGSPASCGLIVVYGSSAASPVAPTDATIRAAITTDGGAGSQAAYGIITELTISSVQTAITNVNINAGMKLAQIGTTRIADGAITAPKIAFATLSWYKEILTNFSTTATSATQVTGFSMPVTVPTGGALYELSFNSTSVGNNGANYSTFFVYDGAVGVGTLLMSASTYGTNVPPTNFTKRVTLAGGAHTLNVGVSAGAGQVTIVSNANGPSSITLKLA